MNKTDEIANEFYAQYGLAMHTIQMLESGLLELYAIKVFINENLTELDYYKILSCSRKWPLGKIKDKLFELNFLEIEVKEAIVKSNKIRIFLAHRFWWEREIEFENENEIVKMRNEIFSFIHIFENLMIIINTKINSIRFENNLKIEEKMGLTDFKVRENFILSLQPDCKKYS